MLSRCSPSYLCDLFEPYIPSHALCSAVVSQQAAGPFPNVPLSSVKPPCWHQTARLCWSLWIPTKNSSFRKPLYLSNPLFVCCPISTWRSKLCAFLSRLASFHSGFSVLDLWPSWDPSLSLSTGFLGLIPDVFNLDLCPRRDSAFPPFSLLFPFPYLCKWWAWALPLVFSCRLSSSWVYSSYLFLSLQNCLTTFQSHFLNICDSICILSSGLSILSFCNACLFCHSDIYCIFLLKAGSLIKGFLVWRLPVWIKGVGPFEPNLWSVILGYAIKMNLSCP